MKKNKINNVGAGLVSAHAITLITLVITIVILIILAGVTINLTLGDNGLFTKAKEAKKQTELSSEEENVKLAVEEALTEGAGTINEDNLEKALIAYLGKKGTFKGKAPAWLYTSENNKMYSITETGKVKIIEESTIISKEKETGEEIYSGYVGYYADVNGDGEVDGIIYADLAKDSIVDGYWENSEDKYSITKVEDVNELGVYYISQKDYEGNFGTNDVVSLASGGEERFYVMALTDLDGGKNGTEYSYYYAACGKVADYANYSVHFGVGRQNTKRMISNWNSMAYGEQDAGITYKDVWGQIQSRVNNGWYVPSAKEWVAFADALSISSNDSDVNYYDNFGLSKSYFSSSMHGPSHRNCNGILKRKNAWSCAN